MVNTFSQLNSSCPRWINSSIQIMDVSQIFGSGGTSTLNGIRNREGAMDRYITHINYIQTYMYYAERCKR